MVRKYSFCLSLVKVQNGESILLYDILTVHPGKQQVQVVNGRP